MLFYILDVHFQGGPQADDEQSNVFCNFIHLRTKTIHHRAVMTWMAKWLAEVYLPSIGPNSQDMAVRYILRFLVSLMESLTNLCTGFCQLWNWLLPLQTPILTGISHFLYHLTYQYPVSCIFIRLRRAVVTFTYSSTFQQFGRGLHGSLSYQH